VCFPSRFYSHTATVARHQQCIAVLAYLAFETGGQSHSCGHGYFSRSGNVSLGKLRVRLVNACGLLEEGLYALSGYLLCGRIHFELVRSL